MTDGTIDDLEGKETAMSIMVNYHTNNLGAKWICELHLRPKS